MKIFELITLPALLAALVGGTNVLTEVTKKVVTVHKAERVALLWAEVLTLCAAFGAVLLQGWTNWQAYAVAGAGGLLAGGVVAYAAMFGYDELYDKALAVVGSVFDYLGWQGKSNDKSND